MEQDGHELLLPMVEEENICLPLPINVVSKYWNIELPMAEALETAKKYSGFNGSVLIEGIESAERHGLACKIIRSSLTGLKKAIDSGIPPIVILPGIPEITQHASVIAGYDDDEKTILHYVQKGTKKGELQEGAIPEQIFNKEWSEEGNLLILLAPPDIMSSLDLKDGPCEESNRLCFVSERLGILKDSAGSLASLKQAIETDSKNPNALYLMGSAMNEQNSPDCLKYYKKCIEINPNSYLSYNGMGNYYLKTSQFERAEESYTKAIGINPMRSAKIYKNRAYINGQMDKNSKAKEDLKSYLKRLPRAPDRGVIEQAIREL